ncbi:OmpL47-type beta-barrel domain-containing protein [Planococcus sp. FY231025]|uniref:OmpL47-type beta-barrel domain-containing protein n=1 Tax=Planococcus sp. FY231025 TaxID=3455699 RepID=UPI003F8F50CD
MRRYSLISMFLSALLVLQFALPTVSVFAASSEAPTNLTVSVNSGNNFLLKWTGSSTAQKYNVYLVKNGEKTLIGSPTNTLFGYANKPEGEYAFQVTAFNTLTGESAPSNQVSYTLVHPKMAAPQELSLTIRNGNDLYLKWVASEFATSYNIYQVNDGLKKLVFNTSNLTRTFPNMPAGDYVYEVHALSDRFGESVDASQAETTLIHPVLAAPAELALTIRNGNDISLKWPASEFATAYNIYEIKDGVKKLINTTDTLTRTFLNKAPGDYVYEVYSVSNRFGESKTAVAASTVLVHPVMVPPSQLTVAPHNGNDLLLRWPAVEFATSYNIYQISDGVKKFLYTTENLTRMFPNLPAGNYQYEVTSVSNRFGESKSGVQADYSLVHPKLSSPTNLNIIVQNGNDLLLKWNEVEFATSYNIYQIKDGVKKFIKTTDRLTNIFSNMPEDWYEYEVTAVSDRFGESAPSKVEYTLGHPTVQSPELKLLSFDEQTATLNWTEISGASAYNVYEVVGEEYVLLGTTDKRNYTVTDIADGKHEYVVTVTHSRFGDSGYSNAVAVEMQNDLTPPVTSSNAVTDWINKDFDVILTAEDDKSGVDKTFYSLNGIDFLEGADFTVSGSQKISFYSTDLAGNVEEVQTAQVNIDKTAPETSSNANSNWHQEFTVQLKAEDEQSGVNQTFYSVNGSEFTQGDSVVVNKEGINTVSFYSTDVAGNVEEAKTAEVKIDRTAPETVSNADGEWHAEFALEFTSTDDKAGVETTYYSVNGAPFKEGAAAAITEDGVNTIEFYSVDKAGNTEAVKTAEVNIDLSAPETVSNADSEWHQEFLVELTATDDKSAVAKTFYSINGSEFAEGSSFTVDQDGINEISFYSVNKAGGTEEVKTAEVKIDRTAPVTESNESADWLKEAVVELTATDDKSGVDKTFYSVNGSPFVGGSTVVITEAGVNEVSFYSIDKVGNKEEVKTIQVNIDGIAPETVSNAGSEWHQEFMVELTATDEHSGVETTFYSVNGSEFVEGTSFAVTEEGVNTISFYSVDKAGNIEETKTAEVKIDRTAPETLSNIEDKWLQGEFGVELTATDEHSGVAKTFYSVDGSEFTEGTSFSVSEEGVHEIAFYSTDAAGNKEEVKTAQVKIDKTAPVLSWNLEDEVALGSELAISYKASDALSGIAMEKLTVNGKEVANGDLVSFDQPGVYTIQVSVTDQAGWTSTLEETITVFIPLNDFKVMPGVIKGNSGVFSIQVGLPKGFSTKDFDLETVTINGVSAISGKNGFEQQAKQGHFRFNREDFKWNDGTQLLEFRGMVGDYLVIGQATVETKASKK